MRIGLLIRKKTCSVWEYFLPLFSVMTAGEAERKEMCKDCEWAYHSHPIVFPEGTKLCTKAFKVYFLPGLKMHDCA